MISKSLLTVKAVLAISCLTNFAYGVDKIPMAKVREFLIKPRTGYVSKHFDWGKSIPAAKRLKVLFMVPRAGFRDVLELAERQNLDYDVWGSATDKKLIDSGEEALLRTLSTKLQKPYDAIVIGNIHFTILPKEIQFKILKKVNCGSGLILINTPRLPYRKVYKLPQATPAYINNFTAKLASVPLNIKNSSEAWLLGKGKVLELSYHVAYGWSYWTGNSLMPVSFPGRQRDALRENISAFLLRSLWYVCGRKSVFEVPSLLNEAVISSRGAKLNFKIPAETQVEIRIRDTEDNLVFRKSLKNNVCQVLLPALAGGDYYCDVLIRKNKALIDFGCLGFTAPSSIGGLELDLTTDLIRNNGPIKAMLKWNKPLPDKSKLVVELLDSPFFRTWKKIEYSFASGISSYALDIKNYYLPTIAGYMRCTIYNETGQALDKIEKTIFLPKSERDNYLRFGFGSAYDQDVAKQMIDLAGWTAGLRHPHEIEHRSTAIYNQRLVAYMLRVELKRGPKGAVKQYSWFFLPPELKKEVEKLNGDECFYRPAVQRLWKAAIKSRLEYCKYLNPVIYSLGDENCFVYNTGYGPSDEKYFQEFLQKKYRTIKKYNLVHKSNYTAFSEVPHLTLKKAKQSGNFPAWLDHREYMEHMFADNNHFLAKEIKKYIPDALVGTEGIFSDSGDLELNISKLDYWGPYYDMIESELLRSFGKDKIRALWWGGYNPCSPFPSKQQMFLLCGIANSSSWYVAMSRNTAAAFAGDAMPTGTMQKYLPLLDRLRFGQAQLMINNPFKDSGIRIYWSHRSQSASLLDERLPRPKNGIGALIKFCYRNGLQFDFVSEHTLERLKNKNIRALFLCGASSLSEEEAIAIRQFVKRGGLVFADRNPGIMNEYLNPVKTNKLETLFGNLLYNKVKKPVVIDDLSASLPGGIKIQSTKAQITPGLPLLSIKKVGKGQAVLANFNFNTVMATSKSNASFDNFILKLLANVGVKPEVKISGNKLETIIRTRDCGNFELLGLLLADDDVEREITVKLAKKKFVYDTDKGFVGNCKSFKFTANDTPLKLFGLFDSRQEAPVAKVSNSAKHGGAINIDLSAIPENRTLSLRFYDPEGKELKNRSFVVNRTKADKAEFNITYNDSLGTYRLKLTDIATGLNKEYNFNIK